MNELGVSLLWCAVQVTAVVVLGGLLCVAARRIGSAAGSVVALTTLVLVVALTLLAASPWPRWWPDDRNAAEVADVEVAAVAGNSEDDVAGVNGTRPRPHAGGDWAGAVANFWEALEDELAGASLPADAARFRWPALLAAAFLAGAAVGLTRLLLGLWAIHRLRRTCPPVADAELRELVDVLQAELSCRRAIELRESGRLTTAATIGWRRPLILLPLEWRQWTPAERRAVLAHEIAHVQNGDFLSMILAQLGLVLHFYHPLVHWLTGRLRLEQELAADARAARLAGGQRPYLTILAEMALRQADRPLGWPARAFLPTRGTFLRRIEMLRDQKQRFARLSPTRRLGTVALLVAAGVAAAGLRAPVRNAVALGPQAQNTPAAAQADAGKIDLSLVPSEAGLVFALRPAALFARPEMQKVAQTLNGEAKFQEHLGLPLEEIEQIALVAMRADPQPGQPPRPPEPRGMIFRAAKPHDWAAFAARISPNAVAVRYAGQTYYKSQTALGGMCYYRPDDRTIVVDQEASIYRYILRGQGLPGEFAWASVWKEVEGSLAAVALDVGVLRMFFTEEMLQQPQAAPFRAFSPLWEETTAIVAGVTLEDKLAVRAVLATPSDEGREKVAQTSQALLTLAGNMLKGAQRQTAGPQGGPDAAVYGAIFGQFEGLLKGARVEQGEASVVIAAEGDAGTVELVAALAPAIAAAREAARRAHSMNNLKQLAIAMHNYHDANGGFPPAVLYSDNGTPYSWRVALLPYLEQSPLYEQYKFDQPWDGPENRKVLEQMPAVFRDPSARNAPRSSSYFVLTGPQAMFADRTGTKFADVLDGTSNTLAIVEAQRDIPWTQPLDIPYDPAQPVPELGGFRDGGFNAAFGDGSVRFLGEAIDEGTLRALITKAGGEVVTLP